MRDRIHPILIAVGVSAISSTAQASFTTEIRAVHSGQCVDVYGNSSADGANIIQWPCHGGGNQTIYFQLVVPTTDTYTLEFQHSSKCLTVAADGVNLVQDTCRGTSDQEFILAPSGSGSSYALESVAFGQVMEVAGASTSNAANVQLASASTGSHREFEFSSSVPTVGTGGGPNAAVVGEWGPVIAWPHIAVSMTNLPDGRVLTWSGSERETWPTPEQTYSATWDPGTGQFLERFTLGHNMFCASQVMMADGRVLANGGRNQKNTPYVSVFDWRNNQWKSIQEMASGGRWYPTTVALADGDVYTAMGTATLERVPERWDPRDGWQLQPDADFGNMVLNPYPESQYGERRWWPLLNLAPNGLLFHSGPTPQMHWINTEYLGDYESTGTPQNAWYHKHGTTVMYDEGKILTSGGWTNGTTILSTDDAFTIDINGPTPVVQNTDPMNFPRKFHQGVILPNGDVMVVGGNTSGRKFSDQGAVLDVEFWDPDTGTWTLGAPMTIPRGYHSTAVLLLDGRVLSAGGGYCSGSRTCNGSSHRDGQVYSPPYLFDAAGNPAVRPELTRGPSTVIPGDVVTVEADSAIDEFTLIKMSATTHGMNTDLRFLRVPATLVNGSTYELSFNRNPNVLTPGYWMLFGLDANGVPSEGLSVQVVTTESVFTNLALDGMPSQSTTAPGTPSPVAANATDGDMSGHAGADSFARTGHEIEPYWEIDLLHSVNVRSVRLWARTDCCASELEDVHVMVSPTPFLGRSLGAALSDPAVTSVHLPAVVDRLAEVPIEAVGRYVRVQKVGTGHLTVDEVQVFGEDNLALGSSATQSSTQGPEWGADKAIDGNRSGDVTADSLTQTFSEPEAWWELDLGSEANIEEVVLWNRTDCCAARLSNFEVFVSSDPFTSTSLAATQAQPGVTGYPIATLGSPSITIPVNRAGRYIRVQLTGTEILTLAEVEVHGSRTTLQVQPFETPPQLAGTSVSFSASAVGTPPLEYAWSFGDGGSTPFSTSPHATHVYASPGRYVVSLQVRDGIGNTRNVFSTHVAHRALTPEPPSASNTLAIEETGSAPRIWSVNPDNDTVTVSQAGAKVAEISVGDAPWSIAKSPFRDEIWVVNKRDATIVVIDTTLMSIQRTITLAHGSQPHGIAFAPASDRVYVALEATGEVVRIDAVTGAIAQTVPVGGRIRHLSVSHDGGEVYVSRFITPPLPAEDTASPVVDDGVSLYGGEVVVLSSLLAPLDTVVLQHSNRTASEHSGPGVPNYLGPAVISPDGTQAWVPSKQDNILAGSLRGGIGITFDQTVRAVSSMIDVGARAEDFGYRIDHDNASVANHAAFGPYGAYMFTALEGNRQVAISDTFAGTELARFDVGRAPQGLAMGPDGLTLYVHNFLDRTVAAYDVSAIILDHVMDVDLLWEVDTVAVEALAWDVLIGKQLFYDARDDRLALDDYMACASCHNDGGADGRVWDFTSRGEGLRNTIVLNGRGGMDHGLLHWSANFDEVQDFENQIRGFAGGTGLMDDSDFSVTADLLGPEKAGLSADLDALATYVASLERFPRSPYRRLDGELSTEADAGRELFEQGGCAGCHFGESLTDSALEVRHDVGTLKPSSGDRLGGLLDGIDTPTLRDAWFSPPYLHDGSAATLEAAIDAHFTASFTAVELDQLATYLRELEPVDMGTVTVDERIRTIPLAIFDAPIVVMGPPSFFGGDPSTIRLQNVGGDGLDYFLDEWDYKDGPHVDEQVGYLVMDASLRQLGGLEAEASSVLITDAWARVSFDRSFSSTPVVVAQVATFADSAAVTTRIRNVSTTGFDIRLREEEAADNVHGLELVHWIAVEPGSTSVLGRPVEVGLFPGVNHTWHTLSFGQTFTGPVLLGNMQTHNGGDTAALRHRNLTGTSVQMFVEEEKSRDNETWHVDETIGYIVIGQ